jgi:hypothetical protein
MAPGLSRSQALTRLTQWASYNFGNFSLAGAIESIAISPEGDRVAFVSRRTVFPYSPPALITPQLTEVGYQQLYVADIADGTLQLASSGYDGQPANKNVVAPSFSANNGPIAFASAATNLVYGAFSDTGSEVFTTTEVKPPATRGVQNISPAPANPKITPEWRISATARSAPDGSVLVDVTVPGAGSLRASARAGVPSTLGAARRAGKRTGRRRPAAHAARARRRGSHKRTRGRGSVVTRTLASASSASQGAGVVELTLRPAASYRSLIARIHGLYANLTVSFATAGVRTLTETLPVDFVQPMKAKLSGRKAAGA